MLPGISRIGATISRQQRRIADWRMRQRLGLKPLSTPPVTEIPHMDRESFKRTGYVPLDIDPLPYERQGMDYQIEDDLLELDDPSLEVDIEGVIIWRDAKGLPATHPVTIAQYGLAALGGYTRTHDRRYLDRAIANAQRLIDVSEPGDDGALWFPYYFPHTYYDVTMPVPWWSSMAQGQPLSLFSRLAAMNPHDARWRLHADRAFSSFKAWRALGKPWITTMDRDGYLWFEEYAGDVEPLMVVNGHIFALYGLYDYFKLTGEPDAAVLFDGGATTVLRYFDHFRQPGGVSYYCVRPGYCRRPEWQNVFYHPVHIQQLRTLASMTGDSAFARSADELASDWQP